MRTVSPPHCVIAPMSPVIAIAASLLAGVRKAISVKVLSRSQPISHLADKHQVSRKFVYQRGDKAQRSLDETFARPDGDKDVLFHLPVTQSSPA